MSIVVPADREYLTAAQAAAEQLPGFTYTEQHIRRLITSGTMATRPRPGTRGREFSYRELPAEAQAEYLKRYGRAAPELATDDAPTRETEKQLRAQARAAIVDAAEAMIARKGSVGVGLKAFAKLYKARKAAVLGWVYENQLTADPDQVRTWRRTLKRDGLDGLLDSRGKSGRPSSIETDPELKNLIIAEIGARPDLAIASCKDNEASGLQGIIRLRLGRDVPVRTLQRFVAPLRPKRNALVKALAAPGAFNNSHRTAIGSYSQGIDHLNQKWEMDATRGDVMCVVTTPDGKKTERRVALTMLIDICTRRACIVVSDQPSGAATRAVIRKAILTWGIPQLIKTDNGKEFTNYDTERMCRELNITVKFSRPFHPWEKPHVERMFGTVMACLFEKFPGYVGHNVSDRREIENKKSFQHRFGVDRKVLFEVELSPADLQARIDAWLTEYYEQAPHIELGMPPAVKAKALATEARHISDERLLDALMMNAKLCTVSKGLIRYKNRYYGSAETGAIEVTPRYNRKVQLRIDPLDPSWAAVYSPDGEEFLCIAKDVDQLQSDERQRMAVECNRNQQNVVNLFVRKIRAVGPTHNIIDKMLASEVPGLTLPEPAAEGMIRAAAPAIEKHVKMLSARDDMDTPPAPIEVTEQHRLNADAFMAPAEPELMVQCNGYERPMFENDPVGFIRFAMARIASGLTIDAEDAAELQRLMAIPSVQVQLEDFAAQDQQPSKEKGAA